MSKFNDFIKELPNLLNKLINSPSYDFKTLTEGRIKEMLGESLPVEGVYLMYDKDKVQYIGRSRTLAQRVGTDERSLGENQATVSKKIREQMGRNTGSKEELKDALEEARQYMYRNYTVKFLRIDDEVLRALFQLYAATELQAPFNSFLES
jgi:hypothetical protein